MTAIFLIKTRRQQRQFMSEQQVILITQQLLMMKSEYIYIKQKERIGVFICPRGHYQDTVGGNIYIHGY